VRSASSGQPTGSDGASAAVANGAIPKISTLFSRVSPARFPIIASHLGRIVGNGFKAGDEEYDGRAFFECLIQPERL